MKQTIPMGMGISRNRVLLLAGLVGITLLVRGAVLVGWPGALRGDPDGYRAIAENLRGYGTFGRGEIPSAYRPPLYPLVLVPCVMAGRAELAIGTLHVVLGLATVGWTYHLGLRWGLGRWAGLAAAMVACDPILLAQSAQVMTETLATFLAVAALWGFTWAAQQFSPRRAMVAGVLAALASLCRPTFLVWMAVAAVLLPLVARRPRVSDCRSAAGLGSLLSRWRSVLGYVAAGGAMLALWAGRNWIQLGRPIVSTTHGGYTLLLANNPSFYDYLRQAPAGAVWWGDEVNRWWLEELAHQTPADELAADRAAYLKACDAIRRQPAVALYSCVVRAGRLWDPLPHQTSPAESPRGRWLRYAIGVWYAVQTGLASIGVLVAVLRRRNSRTVPQARRIGEWRFRARWSRTWLWPLLLAGCFTAIHAVYWTDLRMRAPLIPAVALAAAVGMNWLSSSSARFKSCGG